MKQIRVEYMLMEMFCQMIDFFLSSKNRKSC